MDLSRYVLAAFMMAGGISVQSVAEEQDDSRPQLMSTTGGKGAANQWQSVEAMQKAAEAGNPAACYELGEMHLTGQQVARDVAKAVALLEKAADIGHANAAFRLGKLNADGEVVPKNLQQAFTRYQAAANAGVAEAQFNLGAMYASGRGVSRDYVEGLAWLIVAAKNGADAEGEKQLRDHLTKAKRTTVIADAEKRAAALLTKAGEGNVTSTAGAAPSSAPVAPRPDSKVKLDAAPAPDRIQITPPLSNLSMPAMPSIQVPAPAQPIESGPPRETHFTDRTPDSMVQPFGVRACRATERARSAI
jgi:TPR repeat protein